MELGDLYALIKRLREPDGCPWDREQTLESLRTALVAEAYEVLEAIESGKGLSEELGDAIIVILMLVAIAEERGIFKLEEVLEGAYEKLRGRHPHVFGGESPDMGKVLERWEKSKSEEFPEGINTRQPALMLADEIGRKAARLGFDWESAQGVLGKLDEEIRELREAIADDADVAHEIGDILFAGAMLARKLGYSAEECLRDANARFLARFRKMRELAAAKGFALEEMSLEEMEELWQKAKML
ncbi:MAG: nucleoside triphosphate pyrophosphohydrolase [candidate division WOR-3 bacterium]